MKPRENAEPENTQVIGKTCRVAPPSFCTPEELEPLLRSLRANEEVSGSRSFPRGTLLEDGRLDLCKQDLGPEGVRRVAEALRHNTRVTSLLLGADHLGPEGALAVADLLQDHPAIKTIYMGCNQIGPKGAQALSAALAKNPLIRGVWLKRNAIGLAGAKHLAELFRQNRQIRTIDLVSNDLGPEGVRLIAEALTGEDNTLETLFLCGNQLGSEGVEALAGLLTQNRSLKGLFLSLNRLGDEGAVRLAHLLTKNRSLVTLGLASNDIGPKGARSLAEALREHPTLETLELGFAPATVVLGEKPNRIGDEGALAFAALLRENATLSALDLSQNAITEAGVLALLDALEHNQGLTRLKLGAALPHALQSRLMALLCQNANRRPRRAPAPRADENNVKSVYRTARPRSTREAAPPAPPTPEEVLEHLEPEEEWGFTREDLASCLKVLHVLGQKRYLLSPRYRGMEALRQLLVQLTRGARREAKRFRSQRRKERKDADRALLATTGLRRQRMQPPTPPLSSLQETLTLPDSEPIPQENGQKDAQSTPAPYATASELNRARRCYVCKEPFTRLHFFYDSLCPSCAALNFQKRNETADLKGRVALVTGGRIIIGFQVVLRLLRAGARVIATTRFPHDAARRFAREPDFASFRERLHIYGLDLRHIPSVERFISHLYQTCERLDIIIHNAAQTVYKPPAFYDYLKELELLPTENLPGELRSLICSPSFLFWKENGAQALLSSAEPLSLPFSPPEAEPQAEEQAFSLSSEALRSSPRKYEELLFPPGSSDRYGQPLDLRVRNSWRLKLDEVSTPELLEVHLVNAIAPFILNSRLKRLLMRTPDVDKYIINVSAMEGQFYRANKTDRHPHTNMAKAALNMMTRTSAADYAQDRIYMNSVDTGWITNQNPYAMCQEMEKNGFQTPLDEIDAAARICDPIFTGINTGENLYGYFLKDYQPVAW